ncbi:MAG: metallophosphoesterase [Bacteroidales bacterium]
MFSKAALAQAPVMKIGLIADIQYCSCPTAFSREYSKSLEKVEVAVEAINKDTVNFTVELGDMIDRDFQNFDPVIQRLNTLNNKWIFIPGNHDLSVSRSLKKKVLDRIPAEKGYWSEVIDDLRLVYLNGFVKKVAGWNGALGRNQLAWIISEVDKANQSHQKLIVFAHQLIVPGDSHSLLESQKMIEILSGSQHMVLYICGHKHSGSDHTIGNIRILNLKGMVEAKKPSFAVLSIYPDRWVLKGYGEQESIAGGLK